MKPGDRLNRWWQRLSVNHKLSFGIYLFLLLFFLMTAASLATLSILYYSEANIRTNTGLRRLILEMDRRMERARRQIDDFLIQYPLVGIPQAHQLYAQPSIRESAEIIRIGTQLQEQWNDPLITRQLNLYVAAAKRFGQVSIEVIELVTRIKIPERGIEAKLKDLTIKIGQQLPESSLGVRDEYRKMTQALHDYLLTRKSPFMQSALNSRQRIVKAMDQIPAPLTGLLDRFQTTARQLLESDRILKSKLNDFALLARNTDPASSTLISRAEEDVFLARQRIHQAYLVMSLTIAGLLILVLGLVLVSVRVLRRSITSRILELTAVARELRRNNLEVPIPDLGQDEIGELGRTLSHMAQQIRHHVSDLEATIQRRTARLAASEHRFHQLVDRLDKVAIIGFDRQRNIFFMNRTSRELTGCSAGQKTACRIDELIGPVNTPHSLLDAVIDWLESGRPMAAQETAFHSLDNRPIPVYVTWLHLTSAGDEDEFYAIAVDLSELKAEEAKRKHSEMLYRELFEHSASGIAIYRPDPASKSFVCVGINPAAARMDGLNADEAQGRDLMALYPWAEETGLSDLFARVSATAHPGQLTTPWHMGSRYSGWREYMAFRLPSGEIITFFEDRTEEKNREQEKKNLEEKLQQVKKMEAIGLMAGGVAHDLNNILSGLVSYPELLLSQLDSGSSLYGPLTTIKEAGERAAAVVADLLTVARNAARVRKVVDVNQMIEDYMRSPEQQQIQRRFPAVTFLVDLGDDLPPIACSPVHISKCLLNLVLNGAEAISGQGRVTISSSLAEISGSSSALPLEPGRYVRISVQDTGEGISDQDRERIFEPFYTKKIMGKSGTGLGLAVVWNTVRDHDGVVSVESGESGTVFHLFFPASDQPLSTTSRAADLKELAGQGQTILMVDDEKQQLEIGSRMLEILNYRVLTADSGERALDILRSRAVDLVILDMVMDPGMNGYETYKAMLELRPGQKAIIASGFSESIEVRKTQQLGAGELVSKPYSIQTLGQAVQQALATDTPR